MPKRFRLPWRTTRQIRVDLDDELEFHFQMRSEELMREGMDASDARREAEREFGDQAFTKRYCERLDRATERETRFVDWIADLRHDLRTTIRGLRHRPAFASIAILTVALGVGANTAVFSVLDSVLLRRLPFPNPERLVTVDELNLQTNTIRSDIAVAEYLDWVRDQRSFEGIAVHGARNLTYAGGAAPEMLVGRRVSANFFDVLGVHAAVGRTFREGEDRGVNRIVVLSDGLWNRLFGADRAIVGKPIVLGGDSYTVIGVLPKDFFFPGATTKQFYTPIDFQAAMADVNRARKFHFTHGFARLKPNVTVADGRAELTTIARRLERENPQTSTGHLTTVTPLGQALVGDVRLTILSLMGAALFVLLIVAANLANLALSRAMLRRQEFAVRAALGASRSRLVRLALTESVALALLGGLVGVGVAWWGTPALLRLYPSALPQTFAVHTSMTALAFALGVATLTGLAFGLAPALATRTGSLVTSLRDGSRGASAGRGRARGRATLVVGQVAVAMILVVGAGLLVRTLAKLQSLQLGYKPEGAITAWLSLSGPRYRESSAIVDFWTTLQTRLKQEPSIESVGLSGSVPLAGGSGASLAIDGRANTEPLPPIRYGVFSDGAMRTLGIALISGRDFNDEERSGGAQAVIINRAAAKKFWPAENPIGARVRLGPDPTQPWATVIGVMADYRQEQLVADPPPLAVTNFKQDVWSSLFITLRTKETPVAARAILQRAVRELDPSLAIETPTPLTRMIGGELGQRRFVLSILVVFGSVALLLAVVGVYGVIAYGVTARRQEFGVRAALGAMPRELVSTVLGQGARLACAGLVIGLAGAVLLTRFLSNLLFGVPSLDPTTFVVAASVLGVATLVASWIPARRAATADPMSVLREE
jgi:putative ABC transport system permease protein